MVASVMIPKVPSEPRNSRMKSGPEAWFGTPGVRISVPSGSATSMLITRSSALPYLVLIVPEPRGAR